MPFITEFNDVYHLGIKAACHEAGGYSERVDEQNYDGSILERIYNQIAKADLIVADMTGKNPNVFYEVGYAHALGKSVILLTQKSDDIPFDLKHYPHIVYGGSILQLKEDLQKRVKWAFENPQAVPKFANEHVEVLANGVDLLTTPTIECRNLSNFYYTVVIDFHNSTRKTIEFAQFQIGVLAANPISDFRVARDEDFNRDHCYDGKSFNQSNGSKLYVADKLFGVLPGSWEKVHVAFLLSGKFSEPKIIEVALRLFSEQGTREFPFKIKVQYDPQQG